MNEMTIFLLQPNNNGGGKRWLDNIWQTLLYRYILSIQSKSKSDVCLSLWWPRNDRSVRERRFFSTLNSILHLLLLLLFIFYFTGFSLANSTQRVYSTAIDCLCAAHISRTHIVVQLPKLMNTHDVIRRSFISPPCAFWETGDDGNKSAVKNNDDSISLAVGVSQQVSFSFSPRLKSWVDMFGPPAYI